MSDPPEPTDAAVEAFIARWKNSGAAERSNSQSFLKEFCTLLSLPQPDPRCPEEPLNSYVFEKSVSRPRPDGTVTRGDIDLYRRGCFVLESKQGVEAAAGAPAPAKVGHGKRGTGAWDLALERAYHQACGYVKDLPAAEGRPPFVIVCDVGHCFELYSEFTCTGGTYVRFPDPHKHRITLDDLRLASVRERFRQLWSDPLSLDPSRHSARVTREIATLLAKLATSLEADGHDAQIVAAFLQRCLFSLFAEDTGLLPEQAFTHLIETCQRHPQGQVRFFEQMWAEMDRGEEFSTLLHDRVRRFNGEFFKSHQALPLNKAQLQLLADAAKADWTTVEPAIFGTLLERALDPSTRHALGAHYTPRAYVERLVFPTVIQPLRQEWDAVKAAAAVSVMAADELRERIDTSDPNADGRLRWIADEKKLRAAAVQPLITFQKRLADIRVLDPACGSGNFLYVTFEHLKRIEGEVLELEEAILSDRARLDMDVTRVHPSHFLGIELNPRAAALAELVLWIGYLQWQHRSGKFLPDDPVLSSTRSVQHADAVLAHDGIRFLTDEDGNTVRRWNGRTFKKHPVTGEDVPDESATAPVAQLINPRPAPPWPDADYIVGNPPFIGNKRMRDVLGDGYTEALRKCWPDVSDTADFVMYWWQRAASLVCQGDVKRFGLITTNSITQTFNRRIVEAHLKVSSGRSSDAPGPVILHSLELLFAIPDHPWVDSKDGADVRIAITVGAQADGSIRGNGILATVIDERQGADEFEGVEVTLREQTGVINADLTVGTDVTAASRLKANAGLCFQGMNLVGEGFRLNAEEIGTLGYQLDRLPPVVRRYQKGRPLLQGGDSGWVIDCFGLTAEEVCSKHGPVYQRLLTRVKPERDHNKRASRKKNWWLFGEPVGKLRRALTGLSRYIVTVETSKFKPFVFLDATVIPDHKLYAIASRDALILGVLSSIVHQAWGLAAGGHLGVGNDPTWTNTSTFLPFPFPALTPDSELIFRIRSLGEQLDAQRKARQAMHPELTLTGMYNVLTSLRGGAPLTAKEKLIHEQGLVSVLRQLHDNLDRAVLEAYGWSDIEILYNHLSPDAPQPDGLQPGDRLTEDPGALSHETREALLLRLAALNRERAAEEAAGHIRWLRPDFQAGHLDCGSPLPLSEGDGGAGSGAGEDQPGKGGVPPSPPPAARQSQSGRGLPQSKTPAPVAKEKTATLPWPADLPAQATALRQLLTAFPRGATVPQLAERFSKAPKPALTKLLETLAALGHARQESGQWHSS